jgi:hypothetical protein
MGGIWVIMRADSEQQITAKYPELAVVAERPAWMTDAIYKKFHASLSFDVNQPPSDCCSR